MRIALISDTFPPLRNSGAVQLRDLSREFVRQGHQTTVLLPSAEQKESWRLEEAYGGVQVLRLKTPPLKDISYLRRTFGELVMPFAMLHNLRKTPLANESWDGVVWYSPSIFHAPLAYALKKSSRCKTYLIIRDIFPEWAVDVGLMGRGLPYLFFNAVARYQYSVADVIGVQTESNQDYFAQWQMKSGRKLEVLLNWLDKPIPTKCSIQIKETKLSSRKIFVYAGNMGMAQGVEILLDLAKELESRSDIGLLFVGRGSEVNKLKALTNSRQINNVVFFDEIDPDEIPNLFTQCSAGVVTLDPRHKLHNIPGKFLNYIQCGLPILALVNEGNELAKMIKAEKIGQVCESNAVEDLLKKAEKLLTQIETDASLSKRCYSLFKRKFTVKKAVQQIVNALI